ncbi:response regulator [Christiangramia sp. OXR-203]|jgi:DNA-binding response OmpR family regulator|uniref:Transcriptional regulator n=1 Tax=uncultured Bacteroidota bacterium TaxID=152509 RepID=A0A1B0Z1S3_9BACT|nr:response regulator [Christiangramia sp. OXR-203]ANO58146.1 transcriptional regulator [uncultured Bacteroidetes bacterium]WPY98689.1 response regulator [Christiangramia sp. OXR-203]
MKKLLLIEDDVTVRENTAELLELSNYDVITASNGKLGIETAQQEIPDIIICDIMMPEIDGYGVLEALSKNPSTLNIPFIFLSAKTEHKDIRKGMDLGADDYLTKPFEEEELLSAIESRLAKVAILKSYIKEETPEDEEKLKDLNDLRELFSKQELQYFKKGETIYEKDKHANYFYLVKRGIVKAHRLDNQGKELITELYKEDDFFGNHANDPQSSYEDYATAMEETQLYTVSREEFQKILAGNPRITMQLVEVLNNNLSELKKQLMDMAYGSVRKKTANTILLFAERIEKHPLKSIRISRADLAGVAGMAPESLIRTLSEFKKEGLIEIEGRNIKLLDSQALKMVK